MSESMSPEKIAAMAARIRALIAKADSTAEKFPAEAAAFYAKAEELQRRHQIAEEQLIATDATALLPIVRKITIANRFHSDFWQHHYDMWYWTADHCGVLEEVRWIGNGDLIVTVVGYESDVRYAEALYQAAWLMMSSRLEPRVDPKLDDKENVYRLRSSGMARNRVAQLLWDSDLGKAGHADHAKVGKLYAQACAERGEDPAVAGKGLNKEVFRAAYADSFAARYRDRLRESRDAVDSLGGLPELHGRKERVQEKFWEEFPDQHPDRVAERRKAAAKRDEGKAPAKPSKPRKITKKDIEAHNRRYNSAAAHAGSGAGRAAAEEVGIARGHKTAQRVDATPERGEMLEIE